MCVNETLREPGREDTGNHSVCSTAYIPVSTFPGVFHRAAGVYCAVQLHPLGTLMGFVWISECADNLGFFLVKLECNNQFVSCHQERSMCDNVIGAFYNITGNASGMRGNI